MFKTIVSAGCSLAAGEELEDRDKRYSAFIAKHFNAELIDVAAPGITNELIAQNTITGLDGVDPANTLVIVEWTYSTRLNFCGKNNRFWTIANYNLEPEWRAKKIKAGHNRVLFNDDFDDIYDLKFYFDAHKNPAFLIYNMFKNIHHTEMMLRTKGYKYVFCFADGTEQKITKYDKKLFEGLFKLKPLQTDSLPYFYPMISDLDKSRIFSVAFGNFAHQHNFPVGPFHHPLEKGHQEYGKLLLNFIKDKYDVK